MSCTREDLKARLTDALVGEAEPSMREAVFAHAETCPSCREDRAALAAVLGLLREAPPWNAANRGEEDLDALSAIQRQKIVAAASRSAARPTRGGLVGGGALSWLALAAGLSAVGIALVLARRASVVPLEVEAPVPAAVTSSVHATPAAPEGPMLPRVVATPTSPPVAPAALRERASLDVDVSKEAMQEFRKPVESIEAPARELAKARREAPAQVAGMNVAAPAAGVVLPAILEVEGARDPLQEGAWVVRVVVARPNAAGVACVEFVSAMTGRASRLGSPSHAPETAPASCAGERFEVRAGQSTAALFSVTARPGPSSAAIGRLSLHDGGREIAARPIDRSDVDGSFGALPPDFRIAYIEARLAEGKTEVSRALLPLAEALPDSPVARDLIARTRNAARP